MYDAGADVGRGVVNGGEELGEDGGLADVAEGDRGLLTDGGFWVLEGDEELGQDGGVADLTEGLGGFGADGGDGILEIGAEGVED